MACDHHFVEEETEGWRASGTCPGPSSQATTAPISGSSPPALTWSVTVSLWAVDAQCPDVHSGWLDNLSHPPYRVPVLSDPISPERRYTGPSSLLCPFLWQMHQLSQHPIYAQSFSYHPAFAHALCLGDPFQPHPPFFPPSLLFTLVSHVLSFTGSLPTFFQGPVPSLVSCKALLFTRVTGSSEPVCLNWDPLCHS